MNKKLILGALALSFAFGGDIEVLDPYARTSMPGVLNSAAFMIIKNNSDKDINLISAQTDKSDVTELHTHIHTNGMMQMQKVDFIKIPAKSQAHLK
nr:copper chaperone PCu(A)C [Campylobacter sp.]